MKNLPCPVLYPNFIAPRSARYNPECVLHVVRQSAIHARLHVHVALIGRAEWLSSVLKGPRDGDALATTAATVQADGIIVAICLRAYVCRSAVRNTRPEMSSARQAYKGFL